MIKQVFIWCVFVQYIIVDKLHVTTVRLKMYRYLSSNVTQWKVANSTLLSFLQAPIGLDKGFSTESELNKQYH